MWSNTTTISARKEVLALTGFKLRSILSADLFKEVIAVEHGTHTQSGFTAACHDRWTDLADTLASLPIATEGYLVIGTKVVGNEPPNDVCFSVLAAGRGKTEVLAEAASMEAAENLWEIFTTTLDYAQFSPLSKADLNESVALLVQATTYEIQRRLEVISISDGVVRRKSAGFNATDNASEPDKNQPGEFRQLFPWIPSSDPWRRLLEALSDERDKSALVVHFLTQDSTPDHCVEEAEQMLIAAERIAAMNTDPILKSLRLHQTDSLRPEAFRRLSILEGKTLAMRVFLTSAGTVSPSLRSIISTSVSDSSAHDWQHGHETAFKGGAKFLLSNESETTLSLKAVGLVSMFGPQEAGAILRTPLPTNQDLPGIRIARSRTLSMTGQSGNDCPLGNNVHRGVQKSVAIDKGMRFRHCYVIGQTGTGKSTLLLNSIIHDIVAGRGVGVLDPHGSLIDDILLRYPEDRADDLVLIDIADTEWPIPFNILRIKDDDPMSYRRSRDLLIDDLLSFFSRTYNAETMGPMFETHMRGFLGLLLGRETQEEPLIPNLLIFRSLYQNQGLRDMLIRRVAESDYLIQEFISEVTSATFDSSLANMSQYITSKFNRFVSDESLRNITCQNDCLDIDEIVNSGKVLLFYLGKGRFGDQAAGLLASQIISRIRTAVMKRGSGDDIRPFFLYADEFQLFADKRFAELLAEARKFKLSLTIAHQYTKQIPEEILSAVLGNIGTLISFRIGVPDADLIGQSFAPHFNDRDLVSLPNFNAYIRSFGKLGETPFNLETTRASDYFDESKSDRLRKLSRYKYARPREEVEKEIRHTFEAYRDLKT